jgi:hypothetical protein
MRQFGTAALAAGLVALVAAPAADAAFPKFKDKTIVVGKSIGGVKLGSTIAKGKVAWGTAGGACLTPTSCFYRLKGDSNGTKGEGIFDASSGKIVNINIKAPTRSKGGHTYTAPFTTPKTSKGIGIGSTLAQVKKAYPKVKVNGTFLELKSTGALTILEIDSPTKKVYAVTVQSAG